jgi:hypothetical protein
MMQPTLLVFSVLPLLLLEYVQSFALDPKSRSRVMMDVLASSTLGEPPEEL